MTRKYRIGDKVYYDNMLYTITEAYLISEPIHEISRKAEYGISQRLANEEELTPVYVVEFKTQLNKVLEYCLK